MPKVSVIIPLYNTERYIPETIASVLCQSFSDFEVIIVDDGSIDRGPELAMTTGDSRVRVTKQANRGLAGARNTGIRESKGQYLAFLDADDLWCPEKLRRHVQHLDNDSKLGVSFSTSALIDEDSNSIGMVQRPRSKALNAAHIFCRNPVGNGSAPVVRRELLNDMVFYDETRGYQCWFDEDFRQSEDIEFWTRIAVTTTWEFGCIDAPLTLYRISSSGLSANTDAQFQSWLRFRKKLAILAPEFVETFGDVAEAYQWRYLARRALKSGKGRLALALGLRSLRVSPQVFLEEPVRTTATILASASSLILSPTQFDQLSSWAEGFFSRRSIRI